MPKPTLAERFWSKVDAGGDCWEWTGARAAGYGRFNVEKRAEPAHRVAWELLVGPIPAGLTIDHLCRNRACVNPDHLEPVTFTENVLRGESPPARAARVTHCPQGHPYDAANTRFTAGGGRVCRTCDMARSTAYYQRTSNARRREDITHCPKGHPYSGDNLYVNPRGARECRACRRARVVAWEARHGRPR